MGAPIGTHSITITGTGADGRTHSTTYSLTVTSPPILREAEKRVPALVWDRLGAGAAFVLLMLIWNRRRAPKWAEARHPEPRPELI